MNMKKSNFINSQGFTLVELMVVVGIIGILATIAIPNFRKYQAKSKTTEAKIQLSSVYTTMESMLLEYDTYATCLSSGGYNPHEDRDNRFYAVGFGADNTTRDGAAVANGLSACVTPGQCLGSSSSCTGANHFFGANKAAAGNTAVTTVSLFGGASMGAIPSATTFSAVASGAISASDVDRWAINNDKTLEHIAVGY